jgi:nicotinic acid phosphoribosyltransferase
VNLFSEFVFFPFTVSLSYLPSLLTTALTFHLGFTPYHFPKDLFLKFVKENNGYFPVTIQALPEGTVANIHTPVFQISAQGEYSRLVTFLETILTQIWYPSTVATLSRRTKDIIIEAFEHSVDEDMFPLIDTKLHDFGFRGCTSVEQSIIGSCAHLLNFIGTDTLSGAYYAQFNLNNGKPVAQSIPASEHSVMTCGGAAGELQAIDNMIEKFGRSIVSILAVDPVGAATIVNEIENSKDENLTPLKLTPTNSASVGGVFSVVMDSFDYKRALYELLPKVQLHHINSGGHMVLRPDSGDPVEAVLMGLDAGHKTFGAEKNKKGFWVLKNCSVIQGDGIHIDTVIKILKAVHDHGYSAQNVTFGMGGALLQRVNRDTLSFATKLSCTVTKIDEKNQHNFGNDHGGYQFDDYFVRPVMKLPATDSGKISLPGRLRVIRDPNGEGLLVKPDLNVLPTDLFRVENDPNEEKLDAKKAEKIIYKNQNSDNEKNELVVVYDCGRPISYVWDDFDTIKLRVETQWAATKKLHNVISPELQVEIDKWTKVNRSDGEMVAHGSTV